MTATLKLTALALVLSVAVPAFAQHGKSPIVGAWRMTSLKFGTEPGNPRSAVLRPDRFH